MFKEYLEASEKIAKLNAKMLLLHPPEEKASVYEIANFKLPAIKFTRRIYESSLEFEVQIDWFISLRQVEPVTGIGHVRLSQAWKRILKKEGRFGKPYWREPEYKRPFYRDGWYLHLDRQFAPLIKECAERRPYHPSLDALYLALHPNESKRFRSRRKLQLLVSPVETSNTNHP